MDEFCIFYRHRMIRRQGIGVSGWHRINRPWGIGAICRACLEKAKRHRMIRRVQMDERRTKGRSVYLSRTHQTNPSGPDDPKPPRSNGSDYPTATGWSGAPASDHPVLLGTAKLVHFIFSLSSFFVFCFAWPFYFIPEIY